MNSIVEEECDNSGNDNVATYNDNTSTTDDWNDFLDGTSDLYSEEEMPIATASLGLIVLSRMHECLYQGM